MKNENPLEVLVVEDEKEYKQNALNAQNYLNTAGYDVRITVVDNIVDALKELETNKYNMLISDITIYIGKDLPKMDLFDKINEFDFDKACKDVYDSFVNITTRIIDSCDSIEENKKSEIKKNLFNSPFFEYLRDTKDEGEVALVSRKRMNYLCKQFNQEIEYWSNPKPNNTIESIPVVLKAKEMNIPYGIVTRVHTLGSLGNYFALNLISEEEVVIGNMPSVLSLTAELDENVQIDSIQLNSLYNEISNMNKRLKNRVIGIKEKDYKGQEVWAQAIKNVMAHYNINN